MTIHFLKNYEDYKRKGLGPKIARFGIPSGLNEEEIVEMELALNEAKPFPQTLREYLYIGGDFNCISMNEGGKNIPKASLYFRAELGKRGFDISRPIVMVHIFEGKCGTFIYLDEGDDPKPWNCSISPAYDTDEGEMIWDAPYDSFSQMIDVHIEHSLKGIPF